MDTLWNWTAGFGGVIVIGTVVGLSTAWVFERFEPRPERKEVKRLGSS